jgi:outer membrane protein OmpA-like peptidoglycan-associated protein
MRRRSKKTDSWHRGMQEEPESFWVSYSDLISALLLIFALSTVAMMAGIGQGFAKPTDIMRKWHRTIQELVGDPTLKSIKGVSIDKKTGALVISSDHLQFGFNDSRLGNQGMDLLREVVPTYLGIVRSKPDLEEFIEVIEIAGHTDKRDLTGANPQVSRNRAASVYNFLIAEPAMDEHRAFLKQNTITVGFADIRYPPKEVCPDDECEKARRVEITIRLKSAEVLGEIANVLEELKLWQGR